MQNMHWQKQDTITVTVMGIITLLSRYPFRVDVLNNHDAVNYALALDHFDINLHQPHPPGYPLYVILGRAFNLLLHNHLAALVWFSMIFSSLAVVAIYLAGREMFGRRAGLFAALLLCTSSAFWYQGEIAAPYTADLFASALVGWLCYRLLTSSQRDPAQAGGQKIVWITALAVGLAGAFRLQTIMFLFPLFLYALRRRPWKIITGAMLVAGTVFGIFFFPVVAMSGGPRDFMRTMRTTVPIFWSTKTLARSARWTRYLKNADNIGRYTLRTLGELALPFTLAGYLSRSQWLRPWRNSKLLFLAIWVAPTWTVYLLVWPGNPGTILVCMPPLFLLAAAGLNWIIKQPRWGATLGWASLAALLLWRTGTFTAASQYPLGTSFRRFDTRQTIAWIDEYYGTKLRLMREIPTEGTIVYAEAFRHLQYYLPQYRTFSLPSLRRSNPEIVRSIVSIERGASENWTEMNVNDLLPPGTQRIVLFDLPPELLLAKPTLVKEHSKNGHTIRVVSLPANYEALWTPEGLWIGVNE